MANSKLKQLLEESMGKMEISGDHSDLSIKKKKLKPGISISKLKKKYLEQNTSEASDSQEKTASEQILDTKDENDVEVFVMKKKSSDNDASANAEKRTVIGSKSKGILGAQG